MNITGHVMIIITAATTPPVGLLSPIISKTNSDQNIPMNTLIIPHESTIVIVVVIVIVMMMMIMMMML